MGIKVAGTEIIDASGNIVSTVGNIDGRDIAADGTKLDTVETNADVTDTTNVVASLTAGTNVTIAANGTISSTDTNTTYSAGSGLTLSGTTFSNSAPDQTVSLTGSGATTVSGTYPNFTISSTDTNTDTNTTYSAGSGLSLSGTTFSHSDTSSQASSNNSGRTYIQDITLDTYGHVTGIATATETVVNTDTNTTYSADGNYGLTLSGTTFRLENDRRRNATGEDVWSGNTHDYTFYDASVGIRWYSAGAEEMRLTNAGDLHVDGNVTAYSTTVSDIRLKHDIQKIEGALEKVQQLNGYTFVYDKGDRPSAGVIAQEVEKVLPSAVTEDDLPFHGEDGVTYKIVQYDQLHGLLIEAIKELKVEIEELKHGSTK